ncbi:MAG: cation:proton antiporter [Victivallaceae bacterium]
MHEINLIENLAIGLSAALVFGYITHRMGLSAIVGYIIAGIVVSPRTPGMVVDLGMAQQLAEIGVILLMFGVGLHFQLKDLLAVRAIAIPGAIVQSMAATVLGALVAWWFGWNLGAGVVLGLAISVASTVVLIRVLLDNNILGTVQGNIAVGWLVVEDIFTVLLLVLLPGIAEATQEGISTGFAAPAIDLGWAFLKLLALAGLMLVIGRRVIPWVMMKVAGTRSAELFSLTSLVIALVVAGGAAKFFGASPALGAFLGGMVVGQSRVSHQAAAEVIPMRDAFAVLFFVSVGMLFDPVFVLNSPLLIFLILLVILIGKPLAAIMIVMLRGYSVRTALVVAVGLAQVGEFSFILATLACSLKMLPEEGQSVLVACALISITLNPLLFKMVAPFEIWLRSHPALWKRLNARAERLGTEINLQAQANVGTGLKKAIVVGYGPVGKTAATILREHNMEVMVVDLNIETIADLAAKGFPAIYGDACREEILKSAGIDDATLLAVTLPGQLSVSAVVAVASNLNPRVKILVRAHYVNERPMLHKSGAFAICDEETEISVALAEIIMHEIGLDEETIARKTSGIRKELDAPPSMA